MAKKKDEKDVLVVRDEKTGEISVVAGLNADGTPKTPHPCDEGELAWIKKAELRGLPMWEGDKIFLRLLEENVPFFSLKLQYQGDRLDRAVLNGRRIV